MCAVKHTLDEDLQHASRQLGMEFAIVCHNVIMRLILH